MHLTFQLRVDVYLHSWLLFALRALFLLVMLVKSGLCFVYDDPRTVIDWPGGISRGLLCCKQQSGIDLNLFLDVS